jgi:Ni2+-binding GTPase involved in maturation of urease and hydrogenase
MTKQLSITISGPCASGKTTLAIAFRDFLRERGFTNVIVNDVDLELGTVHVTTHMQEVRMNAIKDRLHIIRTVQTQRPGWTVYDVHRRCIKCGVDSPDGPWCEGCYE